MDKLLQASIHKYLNFNPDSINGVLMEIESEVKSDLFPNTKEYIEKLLSNLQKKLNKCKIYREAEDIIQKYINTPIKFIQNEEEKDFTFNKEEYEQFENIMEKYCLHLNM